MSAMSDYLENKSLDHCLGTATFTKPAAVYVALFTAATTDAGGGTEISTSGTGYARQVATWTASSGGSAFNNTQLTFGPSASAWGTIGWFAVYDSAVGGNMLYHGPVTTPKTNASGDLLVFLANDLKVTHQ